MEQQYTLRDRLVSQTVCHRHPTTSPVGEGHSRRCDAAGHRQLHLTSLRCKNMTGVRAPHYDARTTATATAMTALVPSQVPQKPNPPQGPSELPISAPAASAAPTWR